MEMLNRLKSTVTGALPGNPITREFEIGVHCASSGPSLLWKIHSGVKKTTKQVTHVKNQSQIKENMCQCYIVNVHSGE